MKYPLFLTALLVISLNACQRKNKVIHVTASKDYSKAVALMERQSDSAFYYFNKVTLNSKDSLEVAKAYNQMAAVQSDAGDYFGAQESLSNSLKYLKENKAGDRKCLASDYNELAMNSFNLHIYDEAIAFEDQAIKFSVDNQSRAVFINNKANSLQRKKNYPEALKLYQSIITKVKPGGKEYARVLSNLAKTKWLANPNYNAATELRKALQIRQKIKDFWGLNASYGHLADFYSSNKTDSALFFALQSDAIAKRINSPDDRLKALERLIRVAPPESSKRYFLIYTRLQDSIQASRNAARNQFALIRYQAEKNKADNLVLQKDNAEKNNQLNKQRVIVWGVLFLLAASTVIGILWYKKRKTIIEQQSRLHTSKKVHDVVANGLYRIMMEIEHRDNVDKVAIVDKIEVMYEQSRDIFRENPVLPGRPFHQLLDELLSSFAGEARVVIVGNEEQLWQAVGTAKTKEVEHVLQELMVNMRKHSQAKTVLLKFSKSQSQVLIEYSDDGMGLPDPIPYGKGLVSTGNRIREIGGKLSFEPNGDSGLKINISFPIV